MKRASYVLIAEVDILRSASLLEALKPFRLGTLVARDGTEAIQTLQRFGPPIILIVSISLPPEDGFAAMSALRSIAGPKSSAIIALVPFGGGHRMSVDVRRSLGISSVVPYAGSAEALRAAVQKALDETGMARASDSPAGELQESQPEIIEEIISGLTTRATRLTGAAGSVVYLQMKPFERFRAHVDWTSDGADVHSPFAAPYALEWVLRTGDVLVLPDLATHPVVNEPPETLREAVRALIAVPLVGDKDRVVGALCVFDVKPLTVSTAQLEALKALGRDVGHLLEAVAPLPDEQADRVTGLLTREIGRDVIAEEAARARDLRRPMSLILIGVDHFANGDAAQGREAGDRTMGIVSRIVRNTLRASDAAIRWDAGEFLTLLPMVNFSIAGDVAERIRRAVATSASPEMPPITVSGGVTELGPGEHPDSAIARLRNQLAAAKKEGGNRIC